MNRIACNFRSALLCAFALACVVSAASARPQTPPTLEWDPWYVLLPIDQPGGAARIGDPRPVEEDLARCFPGREGPDLGRIFQGKNGAVVAWRKLDDAAIVGSVPELGMIDFAKVMPKDVPSSDASAYLYRVVRARTATTVAFRYGYDDAARIWLNGRLVGESSRPGAYEPLADALSLDFIPGENHLLVKVTNAGGAWRFRLLSIENKPLVGKAAAQEKVNLAIDRGCEYLIGMQLRDGSWAHESERFPGGQTALAVYALLKSGVSPRDQAVQRGVAYLRARPPLHTYTAGCTLLALWALHDEANSEWIADLADELISWQQTGLWAYPEGEPDLSNTQYAVLGLLAAARSGVKIPPKIWRDAITQLLHYQGKTGGFGYHIGDGNNATGSMSAAGLGALAIAKGQLTDGNTKVIQGQSLIDQSLELGGNWLATHFTVTGSPPNDPRGGLDGHWGPYYLYGVERACTLLGLERLAGSDWYWEGATWFLDMQGAKGDFSTPWGEGEPNTCFALLFLGRATVAFTGKSTSAKKDTLYRTDDTKSDVWLRASGDAPLAIWLGGFPKQVLEDYAWKSPDSKGLHVTKVEYLVDGKTVASLPGNPNKAWNGEKFSIQHSFERAGPCKIALRVQLAIEPAAKGLEPTSAELESAAVEVTVRDVAAPHLLAQAAIGPRNLIRASETKAVASTQAGDSPAGAAIDGREASAWTCAPGDKTPSLTLEFERPLRANQVLFSGLGGRTGYLGEWDRATKLELRVNKTDPAIPVVLDPDELKTTLFDLPRQGSIRTLEIRIVERVTGKKYPGRVGFNEVGLLFQAPSKR